MCTNKTNIVCFNHSNNKNLARNACNNYSSVKTALSLKINKKTLHVCILFLKTFINKKDASQYVFSI